MTLCQIKQISRECKHKIILKTHSEWVYKFLIKNIYNKIFGFEVLIKAQFPND